MSRLDADYRQASLRQPAEQPLRQRSSLEPNPIKPPNRIVECSKKIVRVTHQPRFPANAARFVDNAQGRLFDRHVQSSVMFHAALLRLMLVAVRKQTTFIINLKRSTLLTRGSATGRIPHLTHF
ncbi:hypothetical protein ACVMFA_003658 [Bradyrhizobium liaoningense]|nr:hypothetical protein [Bradyrhizobium diazoefficiens]